MKWFRVFFLTLEVFARQKSWAYDKKGNEINSHAVIREPRATQHPEPSHTPP